MSLSLNMPHVKDTIDDLINERIIHKYNYWRGRFWARRFAHRYIQNYNDYSLLSIDVNEFILASKDYIMSMKEKLQEPNWSEELKRWEINPWQGGDDSPLEDFLFNGFFGHSTETNRLIWSDELIQSFAKLFSQLYHIPEQYYPKLISLTRQALKDINATFSSNTSSSPGLTHWSLIEPIYLGNHVYNYEIEW